MADFRSIFVEFSDFRSSDASLLTQTRSDLTLTATKLYTFSIPSIILRKWSTVQP